MANGYGVNKRRVGFGVALVAVSALVILSCGSKVEPPTSTATKTPAASAENQPGGSPLTEDAFRELMTIEDVSSFVASKDSVEAQYRDFRELTNRADPSQVENIESWYGLTLTSGDGTKALSFSVVDFDSVSSARSHYEKLKMATPGMQDMDPQIGEASAQVLINDQGLGGSLVFIKGDKVIPLHTAQPEGQQPLVPMDGIERLARLIASRL